MRVLLGGEDESIDLCIMVPLVVTQLVALQRLGFGDGEEEEEIGT
jgi:hypothetical protein